MNERPQDKSLGELFSRLSHETATILRKEFELATTELTEKARAGAQDLGVALAGGVLAHAGLLVLLGALALGLTRLGLEPWLAALIVGLAAAGIGYVLLSGGLGRLRRISFVPTRTVESLKGSMKWTTTHTV